MLLPAETCYMEDERDTGIRAVKTPLDPRSPYFTVMRNVSQIESAVAHYEAAARGADLVSGGAEAGHCRGQGWWCCNLLPDKTGRPCAQRALRGHLPLWASGQTPAAGFHLRLQSKADGWC